MRFPLLRASADNSFPYCTQSQQQSDPSLSYSPDILHAHSKRTSAPYPRYTSSKVRYGCTNSIPSTKSDTLSSEMSPRATYCTETKHALRNRSIARMCTRNRIKGPPARVAACRSMHRCFSESGFLQRSSRERRAGRALRALSSPPAQHQKELREDVRAVRGNTQAHLLPAWLSWFVGMQTRRDALQLRHERSQIRHFCAFNVVPNCVIHLRKSDHKNHDCLNPFSFADNACEVNAHENGLAEKYRRSLLAKYRGNNAHFSPRIMRLPGDADVAACASSSSAACFFVMRSVQYACSTFFPLFSTTSRVCTYRMPPRHVNSEHNHFGAKQQSRDAVLVTPREAHRSLVSCRSALSGYRDCISPALSGTRPRSSSGSSGGSYNNSSNMAINPVRGQSAPRPLRSTLISTGERTICGRCLLRQRDTLPRALCAAGSRAFSRSWSGSQSTPS